MPRFMILLSVTALLMVSGCSNLKQHLNPGKFTADRIDQAIDEYTQVADQVKIGMDMDAVLAILMPTQRHLPASTRKAPEQFILDGKVVDVRFMRTGRQPDGFTTDDEFTPYVFVDGLLVAIGWTGASRFVKPK